MDYTACDGVPRFRSKPGAELCEQVQTVVFNASKPCCFFFPFEKVWSLTGHLGTII